MGSVASVQLHSPNSESDIEIGGEVVLKCVAEGNGEMKYDWFRNDEQLYKSKNKKFHIKDVSPSSNGVYRCRAHNEAGSVESEENFALKLRSPLYPQVKLLPSDKLATRGDTVRLDCLFEKADETHWYFKGDDVEDSDTRHVHSNGSLSIRNVSTADEGFYTCEAVRKPDEYQEYLQLYSAKLKLAFIEDLSASSLEPSPVASTIIAPRTRPFEVACLAPPGLPTPKVWWRNSSGKNVSNPNHSRSDISFLVFESPREVDSGNYTCVAENKAGSTNFTVQLMISVPPVVTSSSSLVTVDEGKPFTLACPFRGTPYPATVIRWKKDKKYLKHDRVMINKANGSLTILDSKPLDKGFYVCEVNTTGFKPVDSKPYQLIVIEKLKFTPTPVSKNLELGVPIKIPCKAQGTPAPVIRWLKERFTHERFPPHVQDINGTLHFNTVYMTDRGKYICIATSTQGTINATVNFEVVVSPKFKIKPLNPTEVVEGSPVTLHCVADGDPAPTIKWDKNGEINGLDPQRFQIFDNGTLFARYVSLDDEGKYGCTAGNSGGLKREEALLIVRSADGYQTVEDGDESMMTKTVTITLSAAAAYMVLVIGLMVWCRYRRRKRKEAYLKANPEGILLSKTENGDVPTANGEKPEGSDKKHRRENGRKSDGGETAHSQSSSQSKRSSKSSYYEKLVYPRQNLSDLKLIGHGIFGQVFIGRAENVATPVVVKSLQHTRDENVLIEFKRETDMFHRLSHDNIAKIIGLCKEVDNHFMILEHTDWGDLKHFLQTTKKERSKLSSSQIIDIAKQISIGMEYLSNARFVHKDLSARNCIISSDMKVKISMIALSKDVYSADYAEYRNQVIPLRWLPYEAVFEDDYSTKSDVYSFAALCWELYHQGERPFYNIPDSSVIEKLQRRELVIKPSKTAPGNVAAILSACVATSPKDRPTFSSIAIILGEALKDFM
ncbi:UNVERIFIED_CONTAM: hypothetical protein PYX00_006148 [Menopon gallinae]|uniref:Receptor protein-tyrosine kinase n=1 Tax=Menopon gallinae TaxID=328185 RepID=A0AAW2HUH2_9NEOP